MPYIGNEVGNRFVASKAASVYSGNGSTTAFTLEHAVGSDEDILVSVDGVVQEPSVAYAVSSGTTLTFTAAPSSNSGNNIFVYYLFRTVATVDHPSTSALTATSGTFSGNTTVAGTLGVTGAATLSADASVGDDLSLVSDGSIVNFGVNSEISLTHVHNSGLTLASSVGATTFKIGRAGATDAKILFDGNAQDYHIGVDDTNDSLVIGLGNTLGTTDSMRFDANGIITKPLQPAFLVKTADAQNNLALNQNTVIAFGTEIFDNNADFSSNVFTAPVTGKYQLNFHVRIDNLDTVTQYTIILLVTSNRNLQFIHGHSGYAADVNYMSFQGSHLVDMDANDTAGVQASLPSLGTAQADVSVETHFSGYLVA